MPSRWRTGRAPWSRRIGVVAVVFFVAVMGWAASLAGSALVLREPLPRPDAIISLGSHEWERLPMAARLAVAYPDALLLLTQPQEVTPFNCHDCAHRVDRLRHLGVSDARVRVLPLTSPGTHGEALAAVAFARQTGVRRLLITTSPYHTRRALAVFRKVFEGAGVDIGIEPATSAPPARPSRWWGEPYDRAYVAYEWAAIVYYMVKYTIPPI